MVEKFKVLAVIEQESASKDKPESEGECGAFLSIFHERFSDNS